MNPEGSLTPGTVRIPPSLDDRVPVFVLTGFLGSGKTTLLNRVLAREDDPATLVVVNEFGDVGLDHALMVHAHDDGVVELAGGCVCCSLNGDLGRTLADAIWRFSRNGQRQFGRVVVETTGLATPGSITRTLHRDHRVAAHYRLAGVVTVVDAENALDLCLTQPEVTSQVEAADRLVLSKRDRVDDGKASCVEAWVRETNPLASLVDPVTDDPFAFRPVSWRLVQPEHEAEGRHTTMPTRSITLDTPVDEEAFAGWLDLLLATAGPSLLRLKGIVQVIGDDAPRVVHAVQGVAYPAERMPAGPTGTRLVLIGHALARPEVAALLEAATLIFPGLKAA
ncbi:MAG: putative GTP-binding protein YjiA [Luteibacter sp.]|uniref:CobW family GTP-binding protein n=1 Tax=Luteibacter sp. TaxID=1886636 RepID=UPI001384CD9B|nr:GTP-binding protein [Luteibacter sp.]KAF1007507.1 MAG: putative GTP-binding protein YjiA [Luteibacter sp.]